MFDAIIRGFHRICQEFCYLNNSKNQERICFGRTACNVVQSFIYRKDSQFDNSDITLLHKLDHDKLFITNNRYSYKSYQ